VKRERERERERKERERERERWYLANRVLLRIDYRVVVIAAVVAEA